MTPEQYAAHSIHGFIEYYGITNDQGEKLDFKDHPFMWDIYSDWSPQIVGLKAAQVTWSTCFSLKTLFAAKHMGLDIIYSLPTADDARDFVAGKVNRLIAANPILQTWTADKDSIEQKRIGGHNIYYKGTWSPREAIRVPADLYVSDETDRSKLPVVQQFETRLQHSKFHWKWYFSNPSAPGMGVDQLWQDSDQKHWFIKCDGCNKEQFLTMENIQGEKKEAKFVCTHCKKELNRHKGRWIKRWKDKDISGYWVSLLMAPWVSAEQILHYKKGGKYTEEQFTNFVLGLPYVGKGNILTSAQFFANITDKVNPQDSRPIIGVDTGIDIRYTIGNKYGIFNYGECRGYSELEKLLNRWKDAIMVIDQGGDITGPRELREKYPRRVYLCYFRGDRKTDRLFDWDDDECKVIADRNRSIQLLVDELAERRIPIFGTPSEWHQLWEHFSHIYRVEEYNENRGIKEFKWLRSDRDDWVLSTLYWRIGIDRFLGNEPLFAAPKDTFGALGLEVLPDSSTLFKPKIRGIL